MRLHKKFSIVVMIVLFLNLFLPSNTFNALPNNEISATNINPLISSVFKVIEFNNIVYFAFSSETFIKRFDLTTKTWLADITLSGFPTGIAVDSDGIYISFDRRTVWVDINGLNETHLRNTSLTGRNLFTCGDYLFINDGESYTSLNKLSGEFISSINYSYTQVGIAPACGINRVFSSSSGISPADILRWTINSDGSPGNMINSPYHGDFNIGTKNFISPDEQRLFNSAGIIYNTIDLTYNNSLGGAFDQLAFYGDQPIVSRGNHIIGYSNNFLETGRFDLSYNPMRLFVVDEEIIIFRLDGETISFETRPINNLELPAPNQPIDPIGLEYAPDQIKIDENEIIYLLSKNFMSIFRWSVPERKYLTTIPLIGSPDFFSYDSSNYRLYTGYANGSIYRIDLDGNLREQPFVNSPISVDGMTNAGEFLFVYDPSGAWGSHIIYDENGQLISSKDWNYFSIEYVWSDALQKMYFFRDDTTPNDLLWENIDSNGVIGTKMDSPYHSSTGIIHPIRVSPDGSIVLLGSGRIYDPISLVQINTLSNNIIDATWLNGTLYSIFSADGQSTKVQKWTGQNYYLAKSVNFSGNPLSVFGINESLIVVSLYNNQPTFSIWDENLNLIFPLQVFLPFCIKSIGCNGFVDTFDTNKGWPAGEDSWVSLQITNSEYVVSAREIDMIFAIDAPSTCNLNYYSISVDSHYSTNSSINGLEFGSQYPLDDLFYYFVIDPITKNYYLVQYEDSGETLLANGYSGNILSGTSKNNLRVELFDEYPSFYINDQYEFTYHLEDFGNQPTKGGVVMISTNNNSDAHFDNFNLSNTIIQTTSTDQKGVIPDQTISIPELFRNLKIERYYLHSQDIQ